MNWIITYYRSDSGRIPVIDYINSQDAKRIVKIRNALRLLFEFGISESQLITRKLKGTWNESLYEIKIDNSRILYFLHSGRKFILVHGFTKKTRRTPIKELRIARNRMKDYLGR